LRAPQAALVDREHPGGVAADAPDLARQHRLHHQALDRPDEERRRGLDVELSPADLAALTEAVFADVGER